MAPASGEQAPVDPRIAPSSAGGPDAAERVLRELAEGLAREDSPPETAAAGPPGDQPDQPAKRTKARLEQSTGVDGKERESFHENYLEQRRQEQLEEMERESEFAATWHGRLWHWRGSRWLFNRHTRRMEKLIVCGVSIAVLGIVLSLLHSSQQLAAPDSGEVVSATSHAGEELLNGADASRELITKFFQAKTMEEVIPLSRHPDVVRPAMERWYSRHEHRQESNIEFNDVKLTGGGALGSVFYLHLVRFEDDLRVRPIAVEETEDGFRVDWETAVGYQSIDWKDFRAERPVKPAHLRVEVQADDYYNYEFHDERMWSCYRLTHPDVDFPLFGFLKRYSLMDEWLTHGLRHGPEYYILTLRFPENAQSDQMVHIDDIKQIKWVCPYKPGSVHFDEGQDTWNDVSIEAP